MQPQARVSPEYPHYQPMAGTHTRGNVGRNLCLFAAGSNKPAINHVHYSIRRVLLSLSLPVYQVTVVTRGYRPSPFGAPFIDCMVECNRVKSHNVALSLKEKKNIRLNDFSLELTPSSTKE